MVPSYIPPDEGWLAQAKKFILETLPAWVVSIPKVIADTLDNALNISTIFNTTIPNAIQTAKDYARFLVENIELIIPQWIIDAAESVENWWSKMTSYVGGKIEGVVDYAYSLWKDLKNEIQERIDYIVSFINTMWGDVVSYVSGKLEDFKSWVGSAISEATDWIAGKASDAWNWVTDSGSALIDWFNDTAKDAVNWVYGAGITLFNDFQDFKAKIFDTVENAIAYIVEHLAPPKEDIDKRWKEENELTE